MLKLWFEWPKMIMILQTRNTQTSPFDTTNHAMFKVTSITFLPHSSAPFDRQQVVLIMSTCLNTACSSQVIGWLAICLNKQLDRCAKLGSQWVHSSCLCCYSVGCSCESLPKFQASCCSECSVSDRFLLLAMCHCTSMRAEIPDIVHLITASYCASAAPQDKYL